jgi:hypothetical protein
MSRWFHFASLLAAGLFLCLAVTPDVASGQTISPAAPVLPSFSKLSDIEIRLAYETHGGCPGRCIKYVVVVRGEGIVEYEDLGGEPRDRPQRRTIPIDEVVSLVDAFVGARFFEARANYNSEPLARREGDSIRFLERGGADGPEWDLTFRVGSQVKTIHLYMGFPAEFGLLRDMVERIGGPKAWTVK